MVPCPFKPKCLAVRLPISGRTRAPVHRVSIVCGGPAGSRPPALGRKASRPAFALHNGCRVLRYSWEVVLGRAGWVDQYRPCL